MRTFINLLPYMNRVDDAVELLNVWKGGIEISMDGPNWLEPLDWDRELKRYRGHTGPLTVHAPIWELNLASARFPEIRQYSLDIYKQSLEWSARMGAEHVVIHPSLYSTPLFLRRESQQYAMENLAKLGAEAKKLGIEVAVENIGLRSFVLFDEEEFVNLFEQIPTIKALVDVGHAHINGWDVPALIRKLGTKLCAVHLHDNDGIDDLHLPVEMGTIQWQPVWDALNSLEHDCRAILEYREETPVELVLAHAQKITNKLEAQTAK